MKIDFRTMDVIHWIPVKFVKSFLPGAKKLFNLRAARQPVLDIHGIASKADVYNVAISPRVIEEGLSAGIDIIQYLVADGYTVKTSLFELGIRFPGEYSGYETSMAEGKYPCARFRINRGFKKFIREKVKPEFSGVYQNEGFIAEIFDEASGVTNKAMTRGNIVTIHGYGLKIEYDAEHEKETGVFFNPPTGKAIKAAIVPVNEPKKLKIFVPMELKAGTLYTISITTMSGTGGGGTILRQPREVNSDIKLLVS